MAHGVHVTRSYKRTKDVVTRCVYESPKCDKMRLAAGLAQIRWGSLSAPQTP